MKSLKTIGSVLRSACVVFTVIMLCAYTAILLFFKPDVNGDLPDLLPQVVLGIFGFSLMLSCANHIYFRTELNGLLKYFIHLVMTVGSAIAVFMIPGENNGPAALFIGVCLAVFHILFFLIYNIRALGKSKKEAYTPIYDKLKKD